ncbi:hypothetical protein chiPu_0021990 [Chiloscyllium punctatum]|uniref:Uncharacterized protein n=1 Tax=Chiloscyllium punctatum TaxID=137246 RepID=A0A401RGS4_CHIPU|nr:hypothetical protein [Chiloscyllium punctatum]
MDRTNTLKGLKGLPQAPKLRGSRDRVTWPCGRETLPVVGLLAPYLTSALECAFTGLCPRCFRLVGRCPRREAAPVATGRQGNPRKDEPGHGGHFGGGVKMEWHRSLPRMLHFSLAQLQMGMQREPFDCPGGSRRGTFTDPELAKASRAIPYTPC